MDTATGLLRDTPSVNRIAISIPAHLVDRAKAAAEAGIPLHHSTDPELRAWAEKTMANIGTAHIDVTPEPPPAFNPDAWKAAPEPPRRLFRSKEDKKRIARFRRLQKARGNR
jgi:hypothetical protein